MGHNVTNQRRKTILYALVAGFTTSLIVCPGRYIGLVRSFYAIGVFRPAIIISAEYVLIVLLSATSAAVASYGPRLSFSDPEIHRGIFRAVSIAIWTAPLTILIFQHSVFSGPVAAAIVIAAFTKSKKSSDKIPATPAQPDSPDSGKFLKLLTLAIAASAALQAAVLAEWINEREAALLLFILGSALFAVRLPAAEPQVAKPASRWHSGQNTLLNIVSATVFTIAGLVPLLIPFGTGEHSIDALFRQWSSGSSSRKLVSIRRVRLEPAPIAGNGYIGVILTPLREKNKEPAVPPQFRLQKRVGGLQHPLRIRFTGSYWFFQYPFVRPPFDSIRAAGDPASTHVRASNYRPLLMEAVQNLEEPIDATQLHEIQLEIFDADADPATVAIQLVLADIKPGQHSEEALASLPLNSAPLEQKSVSHSETLTYTLPTQIRCKQFNQIRLIFWLAPSRNQQAAAISIENFVLAPKGL